MPRRIGAKKRAALIADIIAAELDWVGIAARYELTPDDLAGWVRESGNRACLTGLCSLADLQAQVLLSRSRLLAASRLIELATGAAGGSAEVSRKACVDLMRMESKWSADPDAVPGLHATGAAAAGDAGGDVLTDLAFRHALFDPAARPSDEEPEGADDA